MVLKKSSTQNKTKLLHQKRKPFTISLECADVNNGSCATMKYIHSREKSFCPKVIERQTDSTNKVLKVSIQDVKNLSNTLDFLDLLVLERTFIPFLFSKIRYKVSESNQQEFNMIIHQVILNILRVQTRKNQKSYSNNKILIFWDSLAWSTSI